MFKTQHRYISILLVDDDPSISESISTYLEDSGYYIIQAWDGYGGLDVFNKHKPDLMLLDLRIPGMDGLDVLSEIDPTNRNIPVIVITGAGILQDAVSALRLGAFDFITKPILDMAVLEHTIQKALEKVRLREENKRYHKYLEEEIANRTEDLKQRSVELEKSNQQLQKEINEKKNTEKQLREVISIFEGFIYISTPEGRIEFMNQKLIDVLGYDASGGKCHEVIFGKNSPCSFCKLNKVFNKETQRFEFFNESDQRWYYAVISPIFDDSGEVSKSQTILIDITQRKQTEENLRQSEANLRKKTKRLQEFMRGSNSFMDIIGKSGPMQKVFEELLRAAESNANVIIYGESGTGKELVAKTIHKLSDRGENNFVTVHCGALPENLIESEFFGYKKGAFTGADTNKQGFLDAAHKGTLFMDEIGELNANIQIKLLRAIEGGGYTPIGSSEVKHSDFRIVAATNRDLRAKVDTGELRNDFFYRIHIIPIHIPPLKEHKEDIPLLVHHFLQLYNGGKESATMPPNIMESMLNYDWPGNVRELQNAVHQYLTFNKIDFLNPDPNPKAKKQETAKQSQIKQKQDLNLCGAVKEFEKQYIQETLEENKWHRSQAAHILGIDRRTLFRKMKAYGLE